MRTQIPAFLERALPRAFSAVLMLVLAALTSPRIVGIYAVVSLVYSGAQAVTDSAVRQVLMRAVGEPDGERFLKRYQFWAPLFSGVAVAITIMVMRLVGTVPNWYMALDLAPMAIAPTCSALGIRSLGQLQLAGRWSVLARGQLFASIFSVAPAVPVLLATHSVLGPALQTLLAEGLMAGYCVHQARRIDWSQLATPHPGTHHKTLAGDMASMSLFSLLAFTQGQAERILLGSFAGPAVLGTYSTASAVGRAAGDSLAASTANVARTAVLAHSDPKDIREATEHTLRRTLLLALGAAVGSTVLSLILRPLLGSQWFTALSIVPILSLSAFPSMLAWTGSVLQVRSGRGWTAVWAPAMGIAVAVFIAIAATHSLILAAYLVVLRDFLVALVAFVTVRRAAPWRAFTTCLVLVIALGAISYLFV